MDNELIKQNVLKLQEAGAKPEDIEAYVANAVKELPKSASGNKTLADSGASLKSQFAGTGKFLGNVANAIATPFVSVAAAPVQLAAKALGMKDPYADKAFPGYGGEGVEVAPATPAGFLQKAGQAATIATLAYAPAKAGVMALTGLGGATGLAQSVGAGNTDPKQLVKDTIYGSLFGMAIGAGGKFLQFAGNAQRAGTGVNGAVKDAISQTDSALLNKYVEASKNHGQSMAALNKPTAVGLAENEFDKRAGILVNQVKREAGEAVGNAKKASAKLPIMLDQGAGKPPISGASAVDNLSDDINSRMQDMTGHQFTRYSTGEDGGLEILNYPKGASQVGVTVPGESAVSALPGRSIDLSKAEISDLENLQTQLDKLRANPTVQTASDVLVNIDNTIGKWENPQFGKGNSPVEAVLKYARGAINRSIAPASPEIAAANSRYSQVMDLIGDIGKQAGKEGQSSALTMRRVLSGDKSNSVVPLLNQIDEMVRPFMGNDTSSLVQHSILSNWSTQMFGDASTKQLLTKAISEGQGGSSIAELPGQWLNSLVTAAARKISPDAAKYAAGFTKDRAGSLLRNNAGELEQSINPLVRWIDAAMDNAKNKPLIGQFVKQMEEMGVTPQMAEKAGQNLFKIYLMQQLTRPDSFTPPVGAPQTLPVGKTLTF